MFMHTHIYDKACQNRMGKCNDEISSQQSKNFVDLMKTSTSFKVSKLGRVLNKPISTMVNG